MQKIKNVWYNTLEKKLNELLSEKKLISSNKNILLPKKEKKDKYERTLQILIYYMLTRKGTITLVENSNVYFPIDSYRQLFLEISDYYNTYGSINIADFSTYLEEKGEFKDIFKEIISLDLDNNVSNDIILDYLKVIDNYNVSLEIKRLENLIMNEVDPLEQAKISNQIRKLKMGSEKS